MRRMRKTVLILALICVVFLGSVPMHVKAATTPPTVDDEYVLSRLSELAELLGINEGNLDEGDGVYFTVNQQKCGNGLGGHACDNCKNTEVANTEWFKNLFGTVTVGGFPKQYREDGTAGSHIGWSCWGFANFVMWYANSTQNTDNVIGTLVTTSTFTKENILSLLEPGYIIRCNGHSMVFISADENTMKVMDSNWRYSTDGENSRVRIREFGYNDSEFNYFKGKAMGITCAANYDPDASDEPSPEEEQVRAFVERMYTVALGREAEADGLDFYTERLLAGDSNGACLAQSFLCSPEFINKGYDDAQYVKVLYKTFFDREPAAEEVNYWVSKLASGQTRAFVLAGFVNSVEFDDLCASYGISRGFMLEDGKPINPGIGRFAERLYTVVLERAGEKEGIEFWSLNIANGVCTPKDAAKNFFLSPEYVNKNTSDAKYITTLYKTFMDREPEAGGVEYWQNVLNNGATREQILEGFADSAEFKGIMANLGL